MFRKAQQSVAHQSTLPSTFNPLGNRDLKALQEIINSEKEFIKSNARSAQDFHKTSEAIKSWSNNEGEDLHDVLGKLSVLFDHYTTAQTRLNAHLSTIRQHFKSIRTREESLAEMRARKRSLGSKIEGVEKKLSKMGPENKELMKTTAQLKELRGEMESLRVEVQAEEAAIGDYKRRTTKEAMGIKCAGLLEMAEKMTIVAEVGKLMIEEIPLEATHPGMPRADYMGAMRTDQLLHEATQGISDVGFAPSGQSQGPPRHGYGHMQASEMNDSTLDYPPAEDQHDEINRAGWDEEREEDRELSQYDHTSAQPTMQPDPNHNQLPNYGGEYRDEDPPTPIYAAHSSTVPHSTAIPVPTEDSATDEWRKSRITESQQPRDSYPKGNSATPIADQFASRSPDDYQVGGTGLRIVGRDTSDEALDRSHFSQAYAAPVAAPTSPLPPAVTTPPPAPHTPSLNGYPGSAGRLSTPPVHSSAQNYGDDSSYFQSIGSTRAAQQSLRRPMSPSVTAGGGGSAAGSATGHIPSSPYEPAAEGRKMTAAAFRKGFGRMASGQHIGGSTTSLGLAANQADGMHNGGGNGGDMTAPLAIRKRYSAVPGQTADGDEQPVPPYNQHQSIYGGIDAAEDYMPAPPQQPWGSRPNSRPGSGAGMRAPPGHYIG